MRFTRAGKIALAVGLAVVLIGGVLLVLRPQDTFSRTEVVGYFADSNGIYVGDDVVVLGVPVGKITAIEPQPDGAKITFWFDDKYQVPATAKAAIIAPTIVSARTIQLEPPYTTGPQMSDHAVIPRERTAVPVEYDDLREQLKKLTETLQPTEPGGVSTLGSVVNTAADNLRGQGANIRRTIIELSDAFSALGDHSQDIFGTVKSLSVLVAALNDSSDLLAQLNRNLAGVTALLANDPDEVGNAIETLDRLVGEVGSFVADNRESLGTTSDKLASVSQALVDSIDDIKQTLHVTPNAFGNFVNIYEPANASLTGAVAVNNFANPISFICGAIQAASRLGAEQAAKLCVQYLAPIIKNRQFNFPPLGENFFVGAQARPNEITYSEEWLRPTYGPNARPPVPPAAAPAAPAAAAPPAPLPAPLPAEAAATDPSAGLPGMMVPPGSGS